MKGTLAELRLKPGDIIKLVDGRKDYLYIYHGGTKLQGMDKTSRRPLGPMFDYAGDLVFEHLKDTSPQPLEAWL